MFSSNFHARRKGESLISSLRALKVGATTLQDAEPILSEYNARRMNRGNCPSADEGYGIAVSDGPIFGLALRYPWLLRLGLRPVGVSATLSFAEGRLCGFTFAPSSLIAGSNTLSADSTAEAAEVIQLTAETTVQAPTPETIPGDVDTYEIHYSRSLLRGIRAPGYILAIHVTIPSNSDVRRLDHTLDFDLSCFTSLRGCRALCQFLPQATRDAIQRSRAGLSMVPEGEIKAPACATLLHE